MAGLGFVLPWLAPPLVVLDMGVSSQSVGDGVRVDAGDPGTREGWRGVWDGLVERRMVSRVVLSPRRKCGCW